MLRPAQRLAPGALLARRQDARQDAVKLLDREIFADVTVSAGAKGGMHPLFVVPDASENDDREGLAHFADKGNEGDAVDLGHVEIDYRDVTAMEFEPGGGLETFSEELAGMTFLFEIGNQELGDGRIIIDEEKLDGIAGEDFHRLFLIITIMSISTILANPDIGLNLRRDASNFLFGL